MSLLLVLLIVLICLAAFVPSMPDAMRNLCWAGAAICLILLVLVATGVIGGGGPLVLR